MPQQTGYGPKHINFEGTGLGDNILDQSYNSNNSNISIPAALNITYGSNTVFSQQVPRQSVHEDYAKSGNSTLLGAHPPVTTNNVSFFDKNSFLIND